MTTYYPEDNAKLLKGKQRVFCNGEEVRHCGAFDDGSHEPDGEGWVEYIKIDGEGYWERDGDDLLIRRKYGVVTWEPKL